MFVHDPGYFSHSTRPDNNRIHSSFARILFASLPLSPSSSFPKVRHQQARGTAAAAEELLLHSCSTHQRRRRKIEEFCRLRQNRIDLSRPFFLRHVRSPPPACVMPLAGLLTPMPGVAPSTFSFGPRLPHSWLTFFYHLAHPSLKSFYFSFTLPFLSGPNAARARCMHAACVLPSGYIPFQSSDR